MGTLSGETTLSFSPTFYIEVLLKRKKNAPRGSSSFFYTCKSTPNLEGHCLQGKLTGSHRKLSPFVKMAENIGRYSSP